MRTFAYQTSHRPGVAAADESPRGNRPPVSTADRQRSGSARNPSVRTGVLSDWTSSRPAPVRDWRRSGRNGRERETPDAPRGTAPNATCPSLLFEPMKRCSKCGEEKPPTEFRRDRSRKDGRYPQCKACERLWRQENSEHLADYHRRWQQANRDKKRAQAATVSASARTPTTGSEGEPGIASIGRGSEPDFPTRLPRQTMAETRARHGKDEPPAG